MSKNRPVPKQHASVIHQEQTYIASGPIPPAAMLEQYRQIRPDLPDLIIEEWIKEATARRTNEAKRIQLAEEDLNIQMALATSARKQEDLRLFIGLFIYVMAFAFAGWLVYARDEIPLAIICVVLPAICTIATSALNAHRNKKD